MEVRFADSVGYAAHAVSFSYGANRPRLKGLAFEPPDSMHILACPAVPLSSVLDIVPRYFVSEQIKNAPNACCKNVENLEIEAWWSQQSVKDTEVQPDIYKFHCQECTACHVRFFGHDESPALRDKANPELLKFFRPMWVDREAILGS